MSVDKDQLPDFSGKCISLDTMDDSVSHDLCDPLFEYLGGRLFIVGTIPQNSTESNWTVGCKGSVAWERVTSYTLFDDPDEFANAIKVSALHQKEEKSRF